MTTLRFAFGTLNANDSFANASAWEGDLDGWHVVLDATGLTATTTYSFADDAEARTALEPRLRAWAAVAHLRDGLDIYFGEPPAADNRERIVRSSNATYPPPDPDFRLTPPVERMLAIHGDFVSGATPLPQALAAVLELVDADALNVDRGVVDAARELAERSAGPAGEPPRYRGPEWQWMQEALRLLTLQQGRAANAAPTRALTLPDFRSEL